MAAQWRRQGDSSWAAALQDALLSLTWPSAGMLQRSSCSEAVWKVRYNGMPAIVEWGPPAGHDDVPLAGGGQRLGGVQAQAGGGTSDDAGRLLGSDGRSGNGSGLERRGNSGGSSDGERGSAAALRDGAQAGGGLRHGRGAHARDGRNAGHGARRGAGLNGLVGGVAHGGHLRVSTVH